MVFDLLWLDGEALYRLPWSERRARLEALGIDSPCWQAPRYFPADNLSDVHEATRKLGLEGIVLKRTDAPYEPGRRSSSWVKLKHVNHDELVVGAIRPPTASRPLSGIATGLAPGGRPAGLRRRRGGWVHPWGTVGGHAVARTL